MALPFPIAASQTDPNSPGRTELFDAFRLNEEDLDTRLVSVQAVNHEAIITDFAQSALDTDDWTADIGSNGPPTQTVVPADHYIAFANAGFSAEHNNLLASTKRMRVQFDTNQTVRLEVRFKNNTNPDYTFFYGLQDATLTGDNVASADLSDCIGIYRTAAMTTKKIKVHIAKASTATLSAEIGNTDNWQSVVMTITKNGATLTVAATLDGSAITGSPWSTNIPDTTVLRPVLAHISPDAADRRMWVDKFKAYWLGPIDSEA